MLLNFMEPLFHESFSHCDMEIVYSKLSILFDRRIINYTIDSFRVLRVKLKKKKEWDPDCILQYRFHLLTRGMAFGFVLGFWGLFLWFVLLILFFTTESLHHLEYSALLGTLY